MRKIKVIILCFVVACLSLTSCSKSDTKVDVNEIIKASVTSTNEELKENENADNFVLTIGNYGINKKYLDKENIERLFKEMYPNATINVVNNDFGNPIKVINELAEGSAPDVVIYSSYYLGEFNCIDGFEDLLQSKYNIENIKPLFSNHELEQCMSFDDKKLIALPFTEDAIATYYRTDVLEQHGIPTDPNELGDLMEKSEGVMAIAEKLKKDNIPFLQWNDELLMMAIDEYGFFDKDMNLNIDNEKIKESMEIGKKAIDLDLIGNYDIWGEEGKEALIDGKVAMLYLDQLGAEYIKTFVPETAGKWRVTRLPLGLYSSSGANHISISSSSKYKMQAANLAKKLIEEDKNYYKSIENQESEFLGGQKSNLLYKELANKLPRRYQTMLDEKVYSIFIDSSRNYGESNTDIDKLLDSTKLKINNAIEREQKAAVEYLRENRKP